MNPRLPPIYTLICPRHGWPNRNCGHASQPLEWFWPSQLAPAHALLPQKECAYLFKALYDLSVIGGAGGQVISAPFSLPVSPCRSVIG